MAQKLSKRGKVRKAARDKKYAMTPNRRKKKAENQRLRRAAKKAADYNASVNERNAQAAEIYEKEGSDCWFTDNSEKFLGKDYDSKDERDLCYIKDLDSYYNKIDIMMSNMKRLIKPSNYESKVFHPIIMIMGSQRRGERGLITMDTDIEMIGRKIGLILHDKIVNELKPTLQNYNLQRCIENRFTVKLQETNLVFLKYES
mgnify:CR=1 FL=1